MKKIKLAKRYIMALKQSLLENELERELTAFVKITDLFMKKENLLKLMESPLMNKKEKQNIFSLFRKFRTRKRIRKIL